MYSLKSIGTIEVKEKTIITVNKEFRKALKYLDRFSHVHVFYVSLDANEKQLHKAILEIEQVKIREGIIISPLQLEQKAEWELIDIKPYFPSEDTVCDVNCKSQSCDQVSEGIRVERDEKDEAYEVGTIGLIRSVNGEQYVQLDKLEEAPNLSSSHIKIFWWFHKFDSNLYRGVTECNPPYENAPRTGIFATRSPVRPNPIAMTIARVTHIDKEKKRIYLSGIESFDKTPCLGISEYIPAVDQILECRVPHWLEHWPKYLDDKVVNHEKTMTIEDSQLSQLLFKMNEKEQKQSGEEIRVSETGKINEASQRNELENELKYRKPDGIIVHGARENNLKGINVKIPYGKITAVVGVSGSGKSSLINDTIYAECNRRMEYLNHNHNMPKPKVDDMFGCIPTVVITQDAIRGNSFSTVGTYTDAYDYLRSIYAGASIRHCPNCGHEIIPLSTERIYALLEQQKEVKICDLSKKELQGGSLTDRINTALKQGQGAFYAELEDGSNLLLQTKQKCYRCDKLMFEMTPSSFSYLDADSRCPVCNGTGKVVKVDESKIIDNPERSLLDGASSFYGKLSTFLENPNANWMKGQVFGLADKLNENLEKPWKELSEEFRDQLLHGCEDEVSFHYNNRKNGRKGEITRKVEGICQIIERLYEENSDTHTLDRYLTKVECQACNGERLNMEGRTVTLHQIRYPEAAGMTFYEIIDFCNTLQTKSDDDTYAKIENAVRSLQEIAESAVKLGIGYLALNQETGTLSGGEGQRLKLLGAFKNHISGILYIFDEPSKALHPSDYQKIMSMLQMLKEEGNTIMMVEHNEDMIRIADYVVEIGPGAGEKGGLLVGEGTLDAMLQHSGTQISRYMNHNTQITDLNNRKENVEKNQTCKIENCREDMTAHKWVKMKGMTCHNLKNISIEFPQNALTCICGVSGSGKSSLMKGEIFNRAKKEGKFSEVVMVDQQAIGKTSKSIIATYIGIMDEIRSAFAGTDLAIQNGWDERYFSFNGEFGQCDSCKGEGRVKLKYMEDTYVQCPDCRGKRFKREILEVKYLDQNIAAILEMAIDEAVGFLSGFEDAVQTLHSLQKVGLGYLKLGQGTATLSGGEASRLKLARELNTKKKKNILYLLDEPTTGLHFSDIDHLLQLMDELISGGNTIVAIEHNKQFMKRCDWQIELGPGAGKDGGTVIRQGII